MACHIHKARQGFYNVFSTSKHLIMVLTEKKGSVSAKPYKYDQKEPRIIFAELFLIIQQLVKNLA